MVDKISGICSSVKDEELALIWWRQHVRDIFRTHKLWPTFIGVKVDPLLEFKGILPVLLWPEQRRHILLSTEKPQTSRKKRKLDCEELAGERIEKVEAPKKKMRSFSFIDLNAHLIEQPPLVIVTDFLSMIKNVFSGAYNAVKATLFESPSSGSSDSLADSVREFEPASIDTTAVIIPPISEVLKDPNQASLSGPPPPPSATVCRIKCEKDEIYFKVFNLMQRLGFFVGPADVYGGDYSIYRGNGPADTHSIATVRVVPSTVRTTVRVVMKRKPSPVAVIRSEGNSSSSSNNIHNKSNSSGDSSNSSSSSDRDLIGNYTVQRTTHQSRPTISARELLAFTRVQTQVAKSAVFAFERPNGISNGDEDDGVALLVLNFVGVSQRTALF